MTVTIDTTTSTTGLVYSNQRKLDRCPSNNNLWACFYNGSAIEFHCSTDDGATWAHDASGNITGHSPSLFIDVDDYAHVSYTKGTGAANTLHYRRGTPNAGRTAWTWSAEQTLWSATVDWEAFTSDVVAHREGTSWVAHVAWERTLSGASSYLAVTPVTTTSGGTITVGSSYLSTGAAITRRYPSIDFHHTGDGKTVQSSTPHVYVAQTTYSTVTALGFYKCAYSGGSWTAGTERIIDTATYPNAGRISAAFDGSRFLMAYATADTPSVVRFRERDAGDTTTSDRSITALADGTVLGVGVSYDGVGDAHVVAIGDTSDDLELNTYDRSAGTWGGWSVVEATTVLADTASLQRGYSNMAVRAAYLTGTVSPYNVRTASAVVLNVAPTAATWDVTDNQAHDVAESLLLDWTFTDPDAGDTQGSYALRKQEGSGSYEYWNAGTSTWGASEVQNTSSTSSVSLAATWGVDGDPNHKYAVKTWDAAGLAGTYSSELTVIPSAQDNPTISSPADAGTVTAPSVTVTWSAATQTAYKARLLSSADAELETSGWVTSASTSHAFSYNLTNGTSYKVEVTTKNDEGLASDADTNSFSVSFTPPATPTLVVAANDATGLITVTITNPGTGATESSNNVYARVASGGRADIDRPVGGDGIRIATGVAVDGTFTDYAVASGVDYEYMVRCFASSGATADSAWT